MKSCAKSCVFLFFLVVADSVHSSLEESTDDILQFLALSEEKMVLDPKHKDVVLVFGNTGAGKTSFIQWIAGDDSKLNSVEQIPGNFILVDNNRIGNSTVQSKTTFPELVVDKETGTAYYDFSGFGDTRGIKNDLATSYFIKRVIDHVDKVKILLVTDYEAVRVGGSRKDFLKLLQHIVELIKNTDKYLPGMGLVVTKVFNAYSKGKLVGDETTVKGIVGFLDDAKAQTAQNINLDDDVCGKIINLISNIISKNDSKENIDIKSYKTEEKIMLFRRPADTGPLSLIPVYQQAKLSVRTVISDNLKFVSKRNEDFSYTVSDDTKYKLHNLIDVLKESLEDNVKAISQNLKNHYENKINITEKNIHTFDIYDFKKAESELIKIQNLEREVNDGIKSIYTLASDIKNTKDCKDIAVILKNTVNKLNVTIPQQIIVNVLSEANFLEFIDEAAILRFKFDTILLLLPIQENANKLNESNIMLKQSIDHLSVLIEENIKNSFRKALRHLMEYISQTGRTAFDFAEIKTQLHNFNRSFIEIQETSNPEVIIKKLKCVFNISQTNISEQVLQKFKDPNYDLFFTNELNHLSQNLIDLHVWYNFLEKLYNEMSSYNVQNSYDVQSRCISLLQSSANYQGRNVKDTNIVFILRDCNKTLYDAEFDKIKNLTLTQYNNELLTNVLNFTLNDNNLTYHCSDTKLIVKGRFVKLSKINLNTCNGISVLEVIALEKVFFDRNFDFTGLNITMIIMAPHWVILGDRKIILDGKPGEPIQPVKAKQGQNGKPGMPGGNAGNFLGYGDQIINSEKLIISANGGNGGPGQAGGDGKPGIDGIVPRVLYSSIFYGLLRSEPADNFYHWKKSNFKIFEGNRDLCGFPLIYCRFYKVTGSSCSDGGDGGHGGVGGEGGAAGVVEAPYKKGVKVSAKNGTDGAPGPHGEGGEGGNTATIFVDEQRNWYLLGHELYYTQTGIKYHQCSPGNSPNGSYNSFGRHNKSSPEPESNVLKYKFSPAIVDFKAYLQQNLNKSFRKQYLLNILDQV